jgi:trehalose 6-phosphate phosphatase
MVLEVRPPLRTDKGTAVAALLDASGLRRALYAGDDTTDLDAFRALETLELGIRVAVVTPEAPESLRGAADVVVGGPGELLELLRAL